MRKALSILKPEVRTRFLRNLAMEKVRYLEVPRDVRLADLKRDIKNGAVHMKEAAELLEKKTDPKYILITAATEEQGLLAVSYLAACFDSAAPVYEDIDGEAGSDTPDMPDISVDASGEPECEEERWIESRNRIPIVDCSDILNYIDSPFAGDSAQVFHNLRLNQQNRSRDMQHPYWMDCTNYSICITGIGSNAFGIHSDEVLFDALDFFQTNRKIYLLQIEKEVGLFDPDGFGMAPVFWNGDEESDDGDDCFISYADRVRNQLVLNLAADSLKVMLDRDMRKAYYKQVLCSHALKNGLGFAKGFSYEKILNVIMAMRSEKTNDLIEKVFRYALKDRELQAGYQFKNDDFSFIDMFARTADVRREKNGRSAREALTHDLVGMDEVKRQVVDVVNMLKFNKLRESKGIRGSQYHNVHLMLGAPGTAKTTVAKLMGRIMVEEKLLEDDRFVCVNGAELKGMYVGHSAPKTKALFENHDIIVIDEAYSLIDSTGEADCFSNEALAQLMIELENHADDRLVIFAGYGGRNVNERNNRMKPFLDANPGIKSRINSTFFFESYSADEMLDIFKRIAANEHYKVQPGAEEELKNYFENRRTADDFGNGREARSLLEGSLLAMSQRLFAKKGEKKITAADMQLIRAADIRQAIRRAAAANEAQRGRAGKLIGF